MISMRRVLKYKYILKKTAEELLIEIQKKENRSNDVSKILDQIKQRKNLIM